MASARIKSFVLARVKGCRALMASRDLDALVVTRPEDVRYLTGFSGEDSVLVLTGRRRVLVTDTRFTVQLAQECPGLAVQVRRGSISEGVAAVLKQGRQGRRKRKSPLIGMETDAVTVNAFRTYRKAIGDGLRGTVGMVSSLRLCKDDEEIRQIRKAVRIAEDAMGSVLGWLAAGKSEIEVAAYLEYEMARRGGGPVAFPSIVAYGQHAAEPHAQPGRQRLGKRQSVLIDWGARVEGYCSDLTRCFVTGKIRPAFAEAYQWILEAQLSAIEAVREGATLRDVNEAARGVLRKSPLPVYGHGTGHGIGLEIHENPFLHAKSKGVLKKGMVITIEPGVYLPGQFGIRIEDDVLVGSRGKTVLSNFPKDLESVSL